MTQWDRQSGIDDALAVAVLDRGSAQLAGGS